MAQHKHNPPYDMGLEIGLHGSVALAREDESPCPNNPALLLWQVCLQLFTYGVGIAN